MDSNSRRSYLTWLVGIILLFAIYRMINPTGFSSFMGSAVPFVVVLGILVFAHELGHYLAARRSGMKVHAFAIGMGPALWSVKRRVAARNDVPEHETTYSICAIPIGGYVRIAGMDPEEDPNEPGGFNTRGWGSRFSTLIAGCVMNFLLAAVLFAIVGSVYGYLTGRVEAVAPGTPAARVGIRPGDRIVGINGRATLDAGRIQEIVQRHPNDTIPITIERDGRMLNFSITPKMVYDREYRQSVPRIGVQFSSEMERVNPVHAIWIGTRKTWDMTESILINLKRMITRESKERVGGPVAIFRQTGDVARSGLPSLIIYTAMLSVNLGLFNLFPIPALDGGRLVFLLIEALRFGRRVDPKKEAYVHFVGIVLLLLMLVIITYRDITAG